MHARSSNEKALLQLCTSGGVDGAMTANCFNGAHRLVSADTAAHICSSAQSEIPAECARDIVSLRISSNTQLVDDAV